MWLAGLQHFIFHQGIAPEHQIVYFNCNVSSDLYLHSRLRNFACLNRWFPRQLTLKLVQLFLPRLLGSEVTLSDRGHSSITIVDVISKRFSCYRQRMKIKSTSPCLCSKIKIDLDILSLYRDTARLREANISFMV